MTDKLLSTLFEKGQIERKIEVLCSQLLSSADWNGNMELIDLLNLHPYVEVHKEAMKYLRKKMTTKIPHVQLLALTVTKKIFRYFICFYLTN
jgi:hypothetical protein